MDWTKWIKKLNLYIFIYVYNYDGAWTSSSLTCSPPFLWPSWPQPTSTSPPAANARRHRRLTHPRHLPPLMLSNGVAGGRRLQHSLPETHERTARTVTTDITAKNGPIEPEPALLDTAGTAPPVCCCCPGNNGVAVAISFLFLELKQNIEDYWIRV